MTLIVPFFSEDFVAVASDRRITWVRNGVAVGWQDIENKAIVIGGNFLMGYTGLARLGGIETDRWVTEKLAGVDPPNYIRVLAAETERALKDLRDDGLPIGLSGHAFVAVGYASLTSEGTGQIHPMAVTISNAIGDTEYGSWAPAEDVVCYRHTLGENPFLINAYGLVPPHTMVVETADRIVDYRTQQPGKTRGVLEQLVELVRRTADLHGHDGGVSRDVSISVLPRTAVPALHFNMPLHSGLLPDPITELTCMFVPDGTDVEHAEVYGPAMVIPGMVTWGAEIWVDQPPPGWGDTQS